MNICKLQIIYQNLGPILAQIYKPYSSRRSVSTYLPSGEVASAALPKW